LEPIGVTYLFLLPQCEETNARHLHNLKAHTRNITFGFTTTTKTRNEDFVVFVNKVQATVILAPQKRSATWVRRTRRTYRHEGRDFFAVLNELYTDTLADGGVGLLGLDTDFLKDDALCM